MTSEPKPCPCKQCGNVPDVMPVDVYGGRHGRRVAFRVVCNNADCNTDQKQYLWTYRTRTEAIRRWNTRHGEGGESE